MPPPDAILPPSDSTLLLVCSYRGAAAPGRQHKSGGLGGFLAIYRDFYANPRSPTAQRAVIERVIGARLAGMRTHIDDPLAATWPDAQPQQMRAFSSHEARAFGAFVLAYPDPLGLTWGSLEDRLLATGKPVFVLNGRGRLFPLTPSLRAALARRRFLAASRLVELAMGCLAIPAAGLLAFFDAARGRA